MIYITRHIVFTWFVAWISIIRELSLIPHLYFQILHTAGQIKIIRYWLTQLVPSKTEDKHKSIATANKIIQKHQKIINFSKNIESIYTYIALLQFVLNTILMCFLGFLIVTVSNAELLQFFLSKY